MCERGGGGGVLTNIGLENNFSADVRTEWELKISLALFRIYIYCQN